MEKRKFVDVASVQSNPNWEIHTKRECLLYSRSNDIRTPYERDYTRILHCLAYQ